jgi:hypothetical protein
MRAAIEYLSNVSTRPYSDLAEFWTERSGIEHHHDEIRSRLRKATIKRIQEGPLEFWKGVYAGEFWRVFPASFPLSLELAKLGANAQHHEKEEIEGVINVLPPELEGLIRQVVAGLTKRCA